MSETIIENWRSDTSLDRTRDLILGMSRLDRDGDSFDAEVDVDWVKPTPSEASLDLLGCYSAMPHIDGHFPEWSVLWVMQHAPGHAVHVADRKARNSNQAVRKPPRAVTTVVPVFLGQVILLNVHRVHWMPLPCERKRFIAATMEFASRPSRAEVDGRIAREAARFAPLAAA